MKRKVDELSLQHASNRNSKRETRGKDKEEIFEGKWLKIFQN